VRSVLSPVAMLAEKYGFAVLVVAHRRKASAAAADDAALGSRAFTAISRSVLHLCKDRQDKRRRLLLPGKNNLSEQHPGLAFSIGGEPATIQWESKPVEMSADEGIAQETGNNQSSILNETTTWLHQILAAGPVAGKTVISSAKTDGITERTLRRAKEKIGVITEPNGFRGPWVWRLPDSGPTDSKELANPTPVSTELAKNRNLANSVETGKLSIKSDKIGSQENSGKIHV